MKKAPAVLLFIFILSFFSCSKHIPAVYEIEGMSLSNSNNTGSDPVDAGTDSVPEKAYAIRMILNEHLKTKPDGGDPEDNGFTNEDKLSSFNIHCLTNFDGTHPAGVSLNSYFLTSLSSSSTITNFIAAGQIGGGHLDNNYNYVNDWSTDQYFFLMSQPTVSGNYSFVIDIGMSDGRQMSDTVSVKLY